MSTKVSSALIDHVVLTRFNVPSQGVESLIRAKEGWLRRRVELFEAYTVPSIERQLSTYTWLIYFDPESPGWFKEWLQPFADRGLFVPVFRASVSHEDLIGDIRQHVERRSDVLITTNLDNDDGIAEDFLFQIQRAGAECLPSAVYLTEGLIINDGRLFLRKDRHNAFCSVRESWDHPVTCWADWHNRLSLHMPVLEVRDEPAWLQVVHDTNVSNRVNGVQVSPDNYRARFRPLLDNISSPDRWSLARDHLVGRPCRFLRESARSTLKRSLLALVGSGGLDRLKEAVGRRRFQAVRSRLPAQGTEKAMEDIPAPTSDGRVTHFVLTRFNVRMPIYQHPGDDWLPRRIQLFEQYCLPSFEAQTNTAFTWLMFADGNSPSWLRDWLEEKMAGLGEVVYVDGVFTGDTAAQAVHARTKTPYVITTRVDNDDAVANDFVETIQSQFTGQELQFINLVNGAQYSRGRVYLRPYTRNPFISLVETVGSAAPLTVFVRRHYELDRVGPIVNIKTAHPMWLQVVHGENVLTELVGLRARADRVTPFFSCKLSLDTSLLNYISETVQGSVRIVWRLASKPRRIADLLQTLVAQRAIGSVTVDPGADRSTQPQRGK